MGELLSKQGNSYLQFVQLLTDMTDITKEKLAEYLEEFHSQSGFTADEMEALKRDDIDELLSIYVYSSKPYISDIAGLFLRNITRFVSRDFYIEKARRAKEYKYKHLACQELAGDANIFIAIAEEEDEGAFLQVASGFSKQEIGSVFEDAYDSVGEFINVTSGLFARSVSQKELNVDMEPPLGFPDQTAKGDFYIIPIVLEDKRLELIISVNSELPPARSRSRPGQSSMTTLLPGATATAHVSWS